jgi:hypothetical protein
MYEKVHRYLELEKIVDSPDFLSRLRLYADLILQPVGHVIFWCCLFSFPTVLASFGYSESHSIVKYILYIASSLQVVMHCLTAWSNMIEFYHLGTLFLVTHIKYARGHPYYKIRSAHPSHQLFRYAAAVSLDRSSGNAVSLDRSSGNAVSLDKSTAS